MGFSGADGAWSTYAGMACRVTRLEILAHMSRLPGVIRLGLTRPRPGDLLLAGTVCWERGRDG
jgi:hypothetical protein